MEPLFNDERSHLYPWVYCSVKHDQTCSRQRSPILPLAIVSILEPAHLTHRTNFPQTNTKTLNGSPNGTATGLEGGKRFYAQELEKEMQ